MDERDALERARELLVACTLQGLDGVAVCEAAGLLQPVAALLDLRNPVQARVAAAAAAAAHVDPVEMLPVLWRALALLFDTDDIVWVELSMWMLEAKKPVMVAVRFGSLDGGPLLNKVCEQADELLPRVANRFGDDLPGVLAAFLARGTRRHTDSLRLLLGAHAQLSNKFEKV